MPLDEDEPDDPDEPEAPEEPDAEPEDPDEPDDAEELADEPPDVPDEPESPPEDDSEAAGRAGTAGQVVGRGLAAAVLVTDVAGVPTYATPGAPAAPWRDCGAADPAAGPVAALAARVTPAGARVLLAGPHDPELVDRLAHADVTCLLRSWPDGSALAEDRPVRVVVGGPGGLPADETFDVVIAAAGLDAVESVEGTPVGWDGLLRRLAAVLAPGGTLLLRLDNPVGLTRMVDTAPWYAGRDDADWAVGGALDAGRPVNLEQARERLAGAGLRPGGCFAAYPEPAAPTALVDAGALAARPGSGLLDAVLHGACAAGLGDRPVLQEPARLAGGALHPGLGAAL
ncbi:hypothetical protein QLR68_15980, partial [Micromonospora sp. DH15]|nr:hypothetical protein [Micromonospora sp. DH15]